MAKKSFLKFSLPVSSMLGSSFGNYLRVASGNKISPEYYLRFFFTTILSGILDPFGRVESLISAKTLSNTEIKESPIFIIGFWRSGTTFLHNLLCLDPNAAYVSTYQSVFPNHSLVNSFWMKKLANLVASEERPVDKVQMNMDSPQEEEMALGHLQRISFYNFFYFPDQFEKFKKETLFFDGLNEQRIEDWEKMYRSIIKKAIIRTGGQRFISKNPPNIFRIPQLLKMFPDARFLYIYRNPYKVLSSFILFMDQVISSVGFQKTDRKNFDKQLFGLFKSALEKYEIDKKIIPKENFLEIKYEDFKKSPINEMETIYSLFKLADFERSADKFNQFIHSQKDQKSGGHFIPEYLSDFIENELSDYMTRHKYSP